MMKLVRLAAMPLAGNPFHKRLILIYRLERAGRDAAIWMRLLDRRFKSRFVNPPVLLAAIGVN